MQIDESTVHGGEALLLAYVHYVENGHVMEEMLFCEELKTTTTVEDIYAIYTQCMTKSGIPLQHVISCAVDGAPAMMGNRKGLLKLKDDNPDMLTVHCVIH